MIGRNTYIKFKGMILQCTKKPKTITIKLTTNLGNEPVKELGMQTFVLKPGRDMLQAMGTINYIYILLVHLGVSREPFYSMYLLMDRRCSIVLGT